LLLPIGAPAICAGAVASSLVVPMIDAHGAGIIPEVDDAQPVPALIEGQLDWRRMRPPSATSRY
jgi:hypothetical protein